MLFSNVIQADCSPILYLDYDIGFTLMNNSIWNIRFLQVSP